jgi:hypothetical protein
LTPRFALSFESHRTKAADPRRSDLKLCMGRRRVIDYGWPATPLHTPLRFVPGYRLRCVLRPMDHGGLVAPFGKPAHGAPVHIGSYESSHGVFATPDRLRPKCKCASAKSTTPALPGVALACNAERNATMANCGR